MAHFQLWSEHLEHPMSWSSSQRPHFPINDLFPIPSSQSSHTHTSSSLPLSGDRHSVSLCGANRGTHVTELLVSGTWANFQHKWPACAATLLRFHMSILSSHKASLVLRPYSDGVHGISSDTGSESILLYILASPFCIKVVWFMSHFSDSMRNFKVCVSTSSKGRLRWGLSSMGAESMNRTQVGSLI